MVPRNIKIRKINRSLHTNYLQKATEYRDSMLDNLDKGRFNVAAGDAIHAVISASDALLVWLSGKRSASEDHEDLVYLLGQNVNSTANINRVKRVLQVKSQVEYGERLFPKRKVEGMVKNAERFYDFVTSQIR